MAMELSDRRTSTEKRAPGDELDQERLSPPVNGDASEVGRRARLQRFGRKFCNADNAVVVSTVLAVVLGMGIGLAVKLSTDVSLRTVYLLSFPGELLMNMLKMLIIPLIISSLVSGLAGLDPKSSGKIGSFALLYYVATTALAVFLGIGLVLIIKPGSPAIKSSDLHDATAVNAQRPGTLDSMLDLLRNLFPPNIIRACLEQQQSNFVNITRKNVTVEVVKAEFVTHTNVLGLVSFSILIGLILGQMGEKALVMVQFFTILNEVVMRMVQVIMYYSPIGIFFLILGKMLEIDNLQQTAKSLGLYMTTVVSGLAIHALCSLALIYFLITRKNPFKFYKGIFQAWITALGTASSAATLPITFKCLEQNLNIDQRVTRFVLPIGATVNMDGTALYEAVASIFIAQINEKHLTIVEVFIVSLTATLAAIGAASVPSAGLVTMMLVLSSVGLPTNDITLLLTVDWLLDRIRTSVNVIGDAVGAGIVHHLVKEELAEKDAEIQLELTTAYESIGSGSPPPPPPDGGQSEPPPHGAKMSSRKRMSVAAALRLQEATGVPIGVPRLSSIEGSDHC